MRQKCWWLSMRAVMAAPVQERREGLSIGMSSSGGIL